MQSAAAGVLAQAPRSLIKGQRIEKDVAAPLDAVFQTVTRPDLFMSLRKSVSQVVQQDDRVSYAVKETFMGAQAEFMISVYPYYEKFRVHHSGKAPYFCVDASIDFTLTKIDANNTHIVLDYNFVMPSLLASFSKKIVAQDRKAQLDAVAQYAESNPTMVASTPSATCEPPPLNTDNVGKSKDKKSKKSKGKDSKDTVSKNVNLDSTVEKLQCLTMEATEGTQVENSTEK